MGRKIWIMNHYASSMFFDQGGRHYAFAKYMKRLGEDPVVFCCNSVHNGNGLYFQDDSLWHSHMAKEIEVPFVFVRGRPYIGNGMERILNMVDFYRNVKAVAKEYAKQHGAPDVVYASSVHPLTLVAGIQLAKYFHVKCVCEVRDLWPESIIAFGVASRYHPAVLAMRRLEKWIYQKADELVFTMGGGYDYIEEQGWEREIAKSKVHYINNGVDLEAFDYNREHCPLVDADLENEGYFKVVYAGSIRRANRLGDLLDAAKQISNSKIKFLIWGKGDELPALEKRVSEENIRNVVFKGYADKKYIPYIASLADLNLAHYGDMPVGRFGVSHNKTFEYMAAGKPILDDVPCNYNPSVEYNAGMEVETPTPENIAKAIEAFADMDGETYRQYCRNARKGAENYDFQNLTKKLLKVMTGDQSDERKIASKNQ